MCVCIVYMSGAPGDQKGKSDPLELESQMIVSCHVGARR